MDDQSHNRKAVLAFAASLPNTCIDHPFEEDFVTTVLRHKDSRKWFGILMKVDGGKIERPDLGQVELLNLKCAPEDGMIVKELFLDVLPAYHMNKTHWITVVLDGSVPRPFINRMIAKSYLLTKKRGKRS